MKYRLILICTALVAMSARCGGPSTEAEDPKITSLDAPTGVALIGDPGTDALEFGWSPVSGAKAYTYRLLKGNTEDKSGTTGSTSVKITGLQEATEYKFDVAATADDVQSKYSTRVTASTIKAAPVTPPVDPSDTDPTSRYAKMQMPAGEEDGIVRAFPGAQGGGMMTTGGRGGTVLHVTKLTDDGTEGTLRWAINQKGARTIVFDVAGIIPLSSRLEIKNGDVTIAGQTAPGDGICLKNYTFRINTSNVIVRYIRCRMGDETASEDDAMNCYTSSSLSNIIVDHCSMSWSTDECGSFYGVKDFTLQYCILSESLRISVHDKGQHGYGGIWGGENASYHHNLIAHHDSRNPRFDHDYVNTLKGPVHYYNNVVYNWGANSSYGGESGKGATPRQINMVANYYKPGPASSNRTRLVNPTTKCSNCNKTDQYDIVPGKFYIADNYMHGSDAVTKDNWQGVHPDDKSLLSSLKASDYMGTMPSGLQTAEKAFASVLAYAGASLSRDKIDTRVTKETRDGTATYKGSKGSTNGLIDTQSDVGGWPAYQATAEQLDMTLDRDGDGMPDWFETKFGLNPANAADGKEKSIDLKGRYTNLEMYLHYIVREITNGQIN